MTDDEQAMYRANCAVRDYTGPIKMPNGDMYPQWRYLLETAANCRSLVVNAAKERARVIACPTCGRAY